MKSKSNIWQQHERARWDAFQAHLAAESGNPLLAKAKTLFPDSSSYGWRFLDRFHMAAVISSSGQQSYYALRGHGVAFMSDESTQEETHQFIFDSEFCRTDDERGVYLHHFRKHPIVVLFFGCDDGHVGMRFATRNDAMDFLNSLDVFEDVFEFSKDPKDIHAQMKAGVTLEEKAAPLAMTLCYHN